MRDPKPILQTILAGLLSLCVTTLFAQPKNDSIYTYAMPMPSYPGGPDSMYSFFGRNIKYPEDALNNDVEGKVVVQVVINKDGWVEDLKVVRSVDKSLDEEALRVVRLMLPWNLGMMNGESVNVRYSIPVTFEIEKSAEDNGPVYTFVDKMAIPEFVMVDFLAANLHYPGSARRKGMEGRVVVKMIIDTFGIIRDPVVMSSPGPELSEEAIRVVKLMPKWKPGRIKDKPVKTYFNLPIFFKLEN